VPVTKISSQQRGPNTQTLFPKNQPSPVVTNQRNCHETNQPQPQILIKVGTLTVTLSLCNGPPLPPPFLHPPPPFHPFNNPFLTLQTPL